MMRARAWVRAVTIGAWGLVGDLALRVVLYARRRGVIWSDERTDAEHRAIRAEMLARFCLQDTAENWCIFTEVLADRARRDAGGRL